MYTCTPPTGDGTGAKFQLSWGRSSTRHIAGDRPYVRTTTNNNKVKITKHMWLVRITSRSQVQVLTVKRMSVIEHLIEYSMIWQQLLSRKSQVLLYHTHMNSKYPKRYLTVNIYSRRQTTGLFWMVQMIVSKVFASRLVQHRWAIMFSSCALDHPTTAANIFEVKKQDWILHNVSSSIPHILKPRRVHIYIYISFRLLIDHSRRSYSSGGCKVSHVFCEIDGCP